MHSPATVNPATKDGIKRTVAVAVLLCLACSIVVSAAAVLLRPQQQMNKTMDMQKNILQVAGLMAKGDDIHRLYERYVEARVINLGTGRFADDIDPATFNQKDPSISTVLDPESDIASIKRRPQYVVAYLIKENGETKYLVLPIYGYGLWSTMYGFIALQNDYNTVYGVSFYQHAETPGLGGEIENPAWKQLWHGKKIYRPGKEQPALEVVKGNVDPGGAGAAHEVDGLAGATLTSRGVGNMLQFWFGELGYQPFLENLKSQRG